MPSQLEEQNIEKENVELLQLWIPTSVDPSLHLSN
jgi:hypothetical protein